MTEAASGHTEVDGIRIHYRSLGSGDPVLLIHGFPTSSHLWRNVMPGLAKTHRAIAIDLPGFGLSDKPLDIKYSFFFFEKILDGFVASLGIEQPALVVHDLGGPVGLFWAVRQPSRISKLVILNTLTYPETSWAVKAFLIGLKLPLVKDYFVSQPGLVGAMRLGVQHKERLNRETLTPYTAPFLGKDARNALIKAGSGLSIKGLAEIAEKLPSIGLPVRIIYGENDRILPDIAKTVARLQTDLPNAEVTALAGCGHFLQEDEPEQLAELMGEFLRQS
ncbi:MAG: alpha/beta fold hydrolase [Myxococcota bacterium]